MLKVYVCQVGCDAQTGNAVVVLNEPSCERMLPIWIGVHEASAICWAMQDIRTARPLTHQLLLNTIEALGFTVEKIEIGEIKNRAFLASIYVAEKSQQSNETGSKKSTAVRSRIIDARPSDAIVLALLSSAPIYVSASVLEKAAVSAQMETESQKLPDIGSNLEAEDEEFKQFVQNLKASDFKLPDDKDGT